MNTTGIESQVNIAKTNEQILACWDVIEVLRPHLKKEALVSQIREMMEQEGFTMIYIEADGKPVAFAGIREMQLLYCGKIIYIDDLCTLPAYRARGYAGQLLDYIHQLAREKGKTGVYLDSGYQRNAAHRLYLNKGYVLNSHHFSNTF